RGARQRADGNSHPAASDRKAMTLLTARRHIIIFDIAAALLIGAAQAGCSTRPLAAAQADATEPVSVIVARVAMADVATVIHAGCVVQARTTATMATRILAPVREVRVLPGDRVRRGQTLIVLDGADLAAASR